MATNLQRSKRIRNIVRRRFAIMCYNGKWMNRVITTKISTIVRRWIAWLRFATFFFLFRSFGSFQVWQTSVVTWTTRIHYHGLDNIVQSGLSDAVALQEVARKKSYRPRTVWPHCTQLQTHLSYPIPRKDSIRTLTNDTYRFRKYSFCVKRNRNAEIYILLYKVIFFFIRREK